MTTVDYHRVRCDVELHVETRGSGKPVIAMGGTASSAVSTIEFADAVVEAGYRLITYDRRGTYRSTDPADEPSDATAAAERQADDVVAILDHLGLPRTSVLATCAGSAVALELLCRHPDRVDGTVVHEPLTVAVLPDPEAEVRALMRYHDLTTDGGGAEGMRAFLTDFDLPFPDDFARAAEREAARGGVLREMIHSILYQPRIADLRRHTDHLAIAVGRVGEERGQVFARTALALANHVGLDVVSVPGHHSAYFFDARPFAASVLSALDAVGGGSTPEA